MGNGDGISKGTIPHEQRVSNRSIINIYAEGQSEMVVFFCGSKKIKVHSHCTFCPFFGERLNP